MFAYRSVMADPALPTQPDNHNDGIEAPPPDHGYEYRDALPNGLARRRAAGLNPGNRFEKTRFHISGETLDELAKPPLIEEGDSRTRRQPVRIPLQIFPDKSQTIINRVQRESDMPFDWTLNPYRGCEHGCIYCYARPYHEYLGFSCGLDFETKITAKFEAPRLLREELAKPSWKAEPIVMSAITDVYQPVEKDLKITRQCLEIMADCVQPVSTMTKSALILRDADLWAGLSRQHAGRVIVTIVTLDQELAGQLEPRAATPQRRLHVVRELVNLGVDVSVNIAPIIPALTDHEVPELLRAVADAGARRVGWVLLRLPYQLKDLFLDWMQRTIPERAAHVESRLRELYSGKLYNANMAMRMRGQGEMSAQIARMMDVFTRKYGLNRDIRPLTGKHFRRPSLHGQMDLF